MANRPLIRGLSASEKAHMRRVQRTGDTRTIRQASAEATRMRMLNNQRAWNEALQRPNAPRELSASTSASRGSSISFEQYQAMNNQDRAKELQKQVERTREMLAKSTNERFSSKLRDRISYLQSRISEMQPNGGTTTNS